MIGVSFIMRNVLTIFRNDIRALYRNFFAFLIILALLAIPALYAWFNIFAFWDPYKNTDNIKIAVVSSDKDYMDDDGKIINIGNELVERLKTDERFGYEFMDDADAAVDAVYSGEYYAAVIIDDNFTYNMYNFLDTDMFSPTIKFYQNEKMNAVAVKIVEAAADSVKQIVNEKYIAAVVETMFGKLNTISDGVRGDSSLNMIKATLSKLKQNLDGYDDTVGQFISANSSLVGTLKNTNSTLDYSIYLIGSERINVDKQIYYLENTQTDLSKINEEVNRMLLSMQDAVQNSIYKLDRLYKGDEDTTDAQAALSELEAQYQELIDFITHSGITGAQAEDALSSLNTVKDKITKLRSDMGMDGNIVTEAVATTIKSDYETVAVPSVYTALTGYAYDDLSDPNATQQSMDGMMDFMATDADKRLADLEDKLDIAKTTNNSSTYESAMLSAISDANIASMELSSLGTAFEALETATGNEDTSASDTAKKAADDTSDFKDKLTDILNGNRDLDLIYDLQLISDAIGVTRVALTESVYPAIDDIIENIQDSLGDVSSILLDISNVVGKAQPIINQLGTTFGSVNSALVQINDLVKSYSSRIGEILGILDGDSDNESIQRILDFLDVDPVTIGQFFAKPVTVRSESVYTVKSYGTAMAPFYSMLAIWVGCIVLNSVMKIDGPVEILGAKENEKFFGRYLVFFLLSQVQTIVIILGDLYIFGISCVHPGLLILTGVVTSFVCSMLAYSFAVAFGNIGKALYVVIMIIQIAGSGGSYPIELLPDFFQQVYLFFPFPYAINAMREAIAGLYQNDYIIYMLKLLIFAGVGLFVGLVVKRSLSGVNEYMNEQLEKTEMM